MVKKGILTVIVITFFFLFSTMASRAKVIHDGDKSYIVDMTGERWDVTQAVSLGFEPRGFQYGIGKNAFTPLDDSLLAEGGENVPGYVRVIGIDDGKAGKAYSVGRLSRHEIANSERGSEKVAVAY